MQAASEAYYFNVTCGMYDGERYMSASVIKKENDEPRTFQFYSRATLNEMRHTLSKMRKFLA